MARDGDADDDDDDADDNGDADDDEDGDCGSNGDDGDSAGEDAGAAEGENRGTVGIYTEGRRCYRCSVIAGQTAGGWSRSGGIWSAR